MRKTLQETKREMKQQNYKVYLERLNKAEAERQDKQIFQNCNSNLLVVRQVRLYKQVKNDLFNWGQLLTIVSNFIVLCSCIFLAFIVSSMALRSYPFLMTPAVSKKTENRFHPISGNNTLLYSWLIHFLSLVILGIMLTIGIFLSRLRQKRQINFALFIEKLIFSCIVVINVSLIGVCVIGNIFYIKAIDDSIKTCVEDYYNPLNSELCKQVCMNSDTLQPSPSRCRTYQSQMSYADPEQTLLGTCIIGALSLSVSLFLLRKIVREYRHKIELYQILLVEFIPDKLSGIALDYRPRDTEIKEVDEEYEATSYQGSSLNRIGRLNLRNLVISQSLTQHPPNIKDVHSSARIMSGLHDNSMNIRGTGGDNGRILGTKRVSQILVSSTKHPENEDINPQQQLRSP